MGVFVIAEAGSTHDNVLENAIRLIHASAVCQANAVKFQVCTNIDKLMEKRGEKKEVRPAYEYLKTTKDWLPTLKAECVKVGIKFGCTAFIPEDIPLVAQHVDFFKIASRESSDDAFVKAHEVWGKQVICSHKRGVYPKRVHDNCVNLYCVVKYPTAIEDLHLSEMKDYEGFSDHTTSTLTGALAVAMGASVIEKHVRLWDTDRNNPDYPHSMICEPTSVKSFAEYVSNIRHAEKCL